MPFYPAKVKSRPLWTPADISATAWYDASDEDTITRAGTELRCQLGLLDFSTGLNPFTNAAWQAGDPYRIIFVSETQVTAEDADLTYYDGIVQAEAEAAGLGAVTWKAIVSSASEDAKDHIGANPSTDYNGPIYDTRGTLIARELAQLYGGAAYEVLIKPQYSAKQLLIPQSNNTVLWTPWTSVWTGTGSDGTATNPMGGSPVNLGIIAAEEQFWLQRSSDTRVTAKLHLYAMSPVLRVTTADLVSQIDDKVGTNHLTQTTEASRAAIGVRKINGLNCLDFDGNSNDYDFTSGIDMNGKMAFMVLASDKYTEQQVENDGTATETQLKDAGYTDDGRGITFAGTAQDSNYGADATTFRAMSQFYASTPYVMGWDYADPLRVFRDGRVEDVAAQLASGTINTIRFGNDGGDTAALNGALCEYVITPSLSLADQLRMEGYLAHKWGATSRLPAEHPYKTNPPRAYVPVVAGSWTPHQMDPLAWLEFAWDKNNSQVSTDNQIDGVDDIVAPDQIHLASDEGDETSRYPPGSVIDLQGCNGAGNVGFFEVESRTYGTAGSYAIDEFEYTGTASYIYFDSAEGDLTHRFPNGSTVIVTGAAQAGNNATWSTNANPAFAGGRTRIKVQGVVTNEGPGSAASGALQATVITTVETSLSTEVVDPQGYAKTVRAGTLYDKAGFRSQTAGSGGNWGLSANSGGSKGSVRENLLNGYRAYDNESGGYTNPAVAAPSSGDYGILMVLRMKDGSANDFLRSGTGGTEDFEVNPDAGSGVIRINTTSNGSVDFATAIDGDGEFHIIGIRFDFTGDGQFTGRLDGAVDTGIGTYSTKLDFTTGRWLSAVSGTQHPHVQIAEYIEFETATEAFFQQMEGYLAWKWGLESSLPTDHPYRWGPPAPDGTAPTLWTPDVLDAVTWFDASDAASITEAGGEVSQWNDKSGKGNHAVQTDTGGLKPSYDSVNEEIDFDGTEIMEVSNDAYKDLQDFAVIGLVRWNATNSWSNTAASWDGEGGGNTEGWIGLRQRGAAFDNHTFTRRGTDGVDDPAETSTDHSVDFIGVGYRNTPDLKLRHDGAETYSASDDTGLISYDGTNRSGIGGYYTSDNWATHSGYLNGAIKELIVFENPTVEMVERIEGYIAWKWGLQAQLDSAHPYKSRPPLIGGVYG